MNEIRLKIPTNVMAQFGLFFGFFFFNTVLVALRSVFVAITILSIYYFCVGIQKALLRI